MSRVFVSYAKEDRTAVEAYVTALRDAGYEVWWDGALRAGDDWNKSIEAELKRADCVVIFWSQYSVDSPWVRIEAHYASQQDCLVPVRIDGTEIPDEYRLVQTVDGTAGVSGDIISQLKDAIVTVTRRQRRRLARLAGLSALGIILVAGVIALVASVTTVGPTEQPDVTESDLWRELQQSASLEELETVENRFESLIETGTQPVLAYSGLCASSLMRYRLTRRDADLAIAEANCDIATELDDGSAFAAEANGWLAHYTGQTEQAVVAFRRSIILDSDSASARLGLGASLESQGRHTKAEQVLLEATVARPGLWRTHNALALFLQRQGRTEESIRRLELALELAPENISILNNLGVSYLFDQNYGEAISAWNRVLEITPANDHGPTLSNIGSAYYLMRDFSAARIAYEKASRFMGDDYRTWDNLADTLSALGELPEERSARRRVLDRATLIYRQNGSDYLALATIAAAKSALGMAGWQSDIQQALSGLSDDPEIHRVAALCFIRAGEQEKAREQYAESLRLGYPEFLLAADYQFDGISGSKNKEL